MRSTKANKANTSPILRVQFVSLQQRFDEQQRKKAIKPKPTWEPTQRIMTSVLVELLRSDRPLRQKELRNRCQRKISPAAFKVALKQLVKLGKIRKEVNSRKNVTYDANREDKTVIAIQTILVKFRSAAGMPASSIEDDDVSEFQEFLAVAERPREKLAACWRMKLTHIANLVATTAFWYAWYMAMPEQDAGTITLKTMLESFFIDDITEIVETGTKSFIQLCKTDRNRARTAFLGWQSANKDRYLIDMVDRGFFPSHWQETAEASNVR